MAENTATVLRKGHGFVHLPIAKDSGPALTPANISKAVLLDRDGVLIEDVGYLGRPAGIRMLPGVPEALRMLAPYFRLAVVTNQSGIGRGMFSEENLLEVHQELAQRLAEEQITIEAYFFCPHHRHGTVKEFTMDCECRKPKAEMLRQASIELGLDLKTSYMVGDNLTDLYAGREVGAKGVIVGENAVDCPSWARPATDLLEAARIILADFPESINSDSDKTGEPASSSPATS